MLQEERSERSRSQIFESALKLFSHRGYGATSVNDIAEEAGLSKGNVYHHFPDKETIRTASPAEAEAHGQVEAPPPGPLANARGDKSREHARLSPRLY
jgi:AcrR family transcriptional regulator